MDEHKAALRNTKVTDSADAGPAACLNADIIPTLALGNIKPVHNVYREMSSVTVTTELCIKVANRREKIARITVNTVPINSNLSLLKRVINIRMKVNVMI